MDHCHNHQTYRFWCPDCRSARSRRAGGSPLIDSGTDPIIPVLVADTVPGYAAAGESEAEYGTPAADTTHTPPSEYTPPSYTPPSYTPPTYSPPSYTPPADTAPSGGGGGGYSGDSGGGGYSGGGDSGVSV